LSLTDEGRETVASLESVWKAVGDVTQELIESSNPQLLEAIARIERALEERSLFSRVTERLGPGSNRCGPEKDGGGAG
ncbi:MAG: hypothetical protein PHQ19_04375, partial [Candidatus Krumholzibacteria bacterium]|nr:hypothetical protein [Candidatus Krumholzibacteria bacterium]